MAWSIAWACGWSASDGAAALLAFGPRTAVVATAFTRAAMTPSAAAASPASTAAFAALEAAALLAFGPWAAVFVTIATAAAATPAAAAMTAVILAVAGIAGTLVSG